VSAKFKSIETKWMEDRERVMRDLLKLPRRAFVKVAGAALGATIAKNLLPPHSFQLVQVVEAATTTTPAVNFTFAYISDTHIYTTDLNDRFVRATLKAVDDVNRLDPQPDFVLFGGDLAQLGKPAELQLGLQILKQVKAPLKIMVGEHDWYLDLGQTWRNLFGSPNYSFDHKGVHFVVLNSVIEKDFWTPLKLTPEERMHVVAGLDNGTQSRFEVGEEQRLWLKQDLAKINRKTPIVVFSHSPLYKYYRPWNFWTEDADEVQALLRPFNTVTVIHGHTHQVLTNHIGNISFHGLLSTAWPWPYAPEGLPKLTVQMSRPNPFNANDGLGDGRVDVLADGMVNKIYNLWDRNPVSVPASYLKSNGAKDRPPLPTFSSF
jgi:3',5'-cyclic-AMP phosphodiesterase